jgi:hypothetical protein
MAIYLADPDPCPNCGIPMEETFSTAKLKGEFKTRFMRDQYCRGCHYAQRAYLDVDDWVMVNEIKGDYSSTILRHIREWEKRAHDQGAQALEAPV